MNEAVNVCGDPSSDLGRSWDLESLTCSLEASSVDFHEIWIDDHDLRRMATGLNSAGIIELNERLLLAIKQNVSVKSLKLAVNGMYGDSFYPLWEALSSLAELRNLYIYPEHDHRMNFEGVRRILRESHRITLLEIEGDWNQESQTWSPNEILCMVSGLIHNVSIEKFKLSQFRAPFLGYLLSVIGMTTTTLCEVDICPDETGSRREPLFHGGALFQLLQVRTLHKLSLGSFVFDAEHCRCFALGFPTSQVRELTIGTSDFPDNNVETLADSLFSNRNLQILGLHWNRIPPAFITYAALALQINVTLSSFSFNTAVSNEISEDLLAGRLSSALQINVALQTLDLSYVNLNNSSIEEIADGIRHNRHIHKLALMNCNLSCESFLNIITAISDNWALSTLLCSGNDSICDRCKLLALRGLHSNRMLRTLGMRNWSQAYMETSDAEECVEAVKENVGLVCLDMNFNDTQNAAIGIFLRLNSAGRGRLDGEQVQYADFIEVLLAVKDDLDCSYNLVLDNPEAFVVDGRFFLRSKKHPPIRPLDLVPCCRSQYSFATD